MGPDATASHVRSLFLVLLVVTASLSGLAVQSDEAAAQSLTDFPYRQEIPVPIDTGQPGATYQPVDLRISFDHA